MIDVGEALRLVLQDLPRLEGEMVALPAALGRVVAEQIQSPRDVPPFRNSAMDGFAVRATDVSGVVEGSPRRLDILETVGAGSVARHSVGEGQAVRIMTGAPLPDGADSVVRVEDTDSSGDIVEIRVGVVTGANVRHPGEDVRSGEAVFERGRVLRPADIGVLASIGVSVVRVVRKPRVAVIATGDELVELGQPLGPGQIVNSNAYTLAAAVEDIGGEAVVIGIVPDEPELLRSAFARGMRADALLSTGGVSVGSFDFVRSILADLGYRETFWKVAQRPGKPLSFGLCDGTPTFGLPGNPVSSLVCFYVYVVPALRTMMGLDAVHLPTIRAVLAENLRKNEALTEFVRCVFEGPLHDRRVRSTGTQSSGVLKSLSLGDGLIVGAAGRSQLESGSTVPVIVLNPDHGSSEPPL